MFGYNRKKQLRNRVIAAAAAVAFMTFGIWLNYTSNDKEAAEEAVQKIEIEEEQDTEATTQVESRSEDAEINTDIGTDTTTSDKTYLVKEENGVVKVYLCEGSKKELYLITSIPYDLLSENDQNMFKEGVTIDTDDDLGKFLENFDG